LNEPAPQKWIFPDFGDRIKSKIQV
jgi:hypothetical protein